MNRWMKTLLGIACHWFFIYMPIFFIFMFGMVFTSIAHGRNNEVSPVMGAGIFILILVHLASIFLMLGTTGLLIAHAIKHPGLDSNLKVVWALLLGFLGILAMPVYFWMYIWPQPAGEPFFGIKETA